MEKQTKLSYWLIVSSIICATLHNLTYGLLGIEEPIFFLLTLLFFFAFIVSVVYNIFTYIKEGEPKDLWKLGWLGLFGPLGFIPRFGASFYGLYGFFAFFGLEKG